MQLVEDFASKAKTIQAVVCDLTDNVIELDSEDPRSWCMKVSKKRLSLLSRMGLVREKRQKSLFANRHHTLQSSKKVHLARLRHTYDENF